MTRTLVAAVAGALVIAAAAAATPSRGLTEFGRIAWNFEALARSYYGTARVCADARREVPGINYTRRVCTAVDLADQVEYRPVFAAAHGSAFTLTHRAPGDLGNVIPLELGGNFIRCSSSSWLVMNGVGGWMCVKALSDPAG